MRAAAVPYEDAGPTMLASMGPTASRPMRPMASWPDLYTHGEARLSALRIWRYQTWVHWAELARFILPFRYKWVVTANQMRRGGPINQSIIDSTATKAMRVCAAGLSSGLMSPSRPWFRFAPAMSNFAIDLAGQRWLDDTAERVYAVLGGSNFYTEAAQMFQDTPTFGTSPMIIYEDREDVIRCYLPCAGEFFLASGARLDNDVLYREFTYTVSQIVEWFHLENCPDEVRSFWAAGGASLEKEFVVCHAIEPNFGLMGRNGKRLDVLPGHFPFREFYWLRGIMGQGPLSLRGFLERPFMVSRWSKTSNNPYATSCPGMDGLGDIKQLQKETIRKAQVIDQTALPAMGAEPELENKPSTIIPGETTYINTSGGKKGFWPLFVPNPQAIPALTEDIKEIQKRIEDTFGVPIFMMISQMEGVQPRNELEIAERKGEKIQQLGPMIELFESEFASPAIQRVVSIMGRRNLLLPVPPSLANVPVSIEYVSMMKLAQRAAATAAMERTVAVIGKLQEGAQAAGLPGPMRVVNLDAFAREYGDKVGFPAKLLYSEDEVAAADQAREQIAHAKEAMAATPALVQAAEGLARIPVGGGMSAVGAALGTGAPTQGNA